MFNNGQSSLNESLNFLIDFITASVLLLTLCSVDTYTHTPGSVNLTPEILLCSQRANDKKKTIQCGVNVDVDL